MKESTKTDRTEMIEIIKSLDEASAALIYAGAQMLKARQDMEKAEKTAG